MPGGILTQFVKRLSLLPIFVIGVVFAMTRTVTLAQEPAMSISFSTQQPITPKQRIELKLNRSLSAAEGKLAVMVGLVDVTALLDVQPDLVSYSPRLPLPPGTTELTVYLVAADYRWSEIARFPLQVSDLAAALPATSAEIPQTTTEQPSSPVNAQTDRQAARNRRRWGFDKIEMSPTATINFKSQLAERHFPESSRPDRLTFTDVALQSSLGTSLARGAFNLQSKFDIVGSSFQKEALRFGELGNAAPQIDLTSYQFQTQLPTRLGLTNISIGHISYGSQRHLINNFSSRGVTVGIPLGTRIDFSAAAMNGTSIVGWSNFSGLNRSKHQVVSGTLGFELERERRGAQRIEVSVSHGSLLPLNNFSQRTITDAEKSLAGTIRLLWSDESQRFRLDAGLSRSRFTNPFDPSLSQGVEIIPVREETRLAHYVDASVTLLRDHRFTAQKKVNLTFNLRHERLDPFFRTIGVVTQADRFQNQFELAGSIGDFNATIGYTRFHDNLEDIPSVLKTLTRRNNLIVGGPLQTLISDTDQPSRWWPRVSYILDRVHQFGAGIPIDAGFRPDLAPDQISINHNFTAEWQFEKWRAAYRFNRSFQNNRQPGRDGADFLNLINGMTIGFAPHPTFDLNLDVNAEQAKNFETSRLDRTLRFAVITNWRMTSRTTFSLNLSTIGAGDLARTSGSRTIEGDAQWSYRFGFEQTRWKKFQGQFFVRYANRFARSRDRVFLLNNLVRTWTMNVGLSFTY